jgi:hypothetical protein
MSNTSIFLSELIVMDETYRIFARISSRIRLPQCGTGGFCIKLSVVGMECGSKRAAVSRNTYIYVNIFAVLFIYEVALVHA